MNTSPNVDAHEANALIRRGATRVLCAADADAVDDRAFTTALALCRSYDARLFVVHVVSSAMHQGDDAIARNDFLGHLRARSDAAHVDSFISVEHGDPADVLVAHAAYHRADLVVAGCPRGDTGGQASVAERILRDATCPTLVVPASIPRWGLGFERVLCAVDLTRHSSTVISAARMLAAPSVATINLLHILDTSELPHEVAPQSLAVDALRRLQRLMPPAGDGATMASVAEGDVGAALLQAARSFGADVIVCGAHPDRGVMQDSTIAILLRHAACPILAVPLIDD
jgi:nucleotide-binding universal stress UspA family protein